jgi:hypothetical protein
VLANPELRKCVGTKEDEDVSSRHFGTNRYTLQIEITATPSLIYGRVGGAFRPSESEANTGLLLYLLYFLYLLCFLYFTRHCLALALALIPHAFFQSVHFANENPAKLHKTKDGAPIQSVHFHGAKLT